MVVNEAPMFYNATRALENYEIMRNSTKHFTLPELTEDRVLVLPRVDHMPQIAGEFVPTIALSEKFK